MDLVGERHRAHADARERRVGDVDAVDAALRHQRARASMTLAGVDAARRIDLDADHELLAQLAQQQRGSSAASAARPAPAPARARAPRRRARASRPGRCDASRSRIARMCAGVVPQQPPTIRTPSSIGARRELGEVLGAREVDEAARRRYCGRPALRHRRDRRVRRPRARSPRSTSSVGCGPTPQLTPTTVGARLLAAPAPPAPGVWPYEGLAVGAEGHLRDDRQLEASRAAPRAAPPGSRSGPGRSRG